MKLLNRFLLILFASLLTLSGLANASPDQALYQSQDSPDRSFYISTDAPDETTFLDGQGDRPLPGWIKGEYPQVSRGIGLASDYARGLCWAGHQYGCANLQSVTRANGTNITGSELVQWADGHYSVAPPNTLAMSDLGLQVYESRQNIDLYSTQFTNAIWTALRITATDNVTTAPDGTLTAAKLVPTAVAGTHTFRQAATFSGTATESIFVAPAGYRYVGLTFSGPPNYVWFDVQTGSITSTIGSNLTSASITKAAFGFYRISATTSTGTAGVYLAVSDAVQTDGNAAVPSFTSDGTSGIYVWAAQTELGSFPAPPIITAGSATTRSFDNDAAIAGALAALQKPSGTVIITLKGGAQSVAGTILGINSLIGLGKTTGNALTTAFGGAQTTANTATWTSQVKVGLRWEPTKVSIVLNGGTIASAANTPPAVTSAYVGSTSGSSAAVNQNILRIATFPNAVSDAQFQAATQ
jgi:hypothetical protein